jgi:multiple sugar transport system permease protein
MAVSARYSTKRTRKFIGWTLRYAVIALVLIFFAFPVFWILSTSFKSAAEYSHSPPIYIPAAPHIDNYVRALGKGGEGTKALRDSLIIGISATLLTLLLGVPTAYSMARFETGGRNFSFWILSQRMMPPVAAVLPIFILYRTVKLLDTHLGLIVLYTVFALPLCIWMMRSYLQDVSVEIEESARMEGASQWQVWRHITLPLVAPGLSATMIFVFIFAWTEFLFALVLTRSSVLTLPVLVSRFFGTQSYEWGVASAVAVIATLPVVILSLFVQRHFVRGMTLGAVKS